MHEATMKQNREQIIQQNVNNRNSVVTLYYLQSKRHYRFKYRPVTKYEIVYVCNINRRFALVVVWTPLKLAETSSTLLSFVYWKISRTGWYL
jgi:hypothetical protein